LFWERKGILLCEFTPSGTTVHADCHCGSFKNLRRTIQNKRRVMLTNGRYFHLDNGRLHTTRATIDLINQYGSDIVKHPPYSPDQAPSDYHLFPALKSHLDGTSFRSNVELKEEVVHYLYATAGEFYDTDIKKWYAHAKVH